MYPWVDMTVNPLYCKHCEHKCIYCYMKFPPFCLTKKYEGNKWGIDVREIWRVEKAKDKTIFVCSAVDLFAADVPDRIIDEIETGTHRKNPTCKFLFQSKNPGRMGLFFENYEHRIIFGTTIETNRENDLSQAPEREKRYREMVSLRKDRGFGVHNTLFVSIEPIMDFDLDILLEWIEDIAPAFVSIGADSKAYQHGIKLPEPKWDKVYALINGIREELNIKVKEKDNLRRLKR